MVRVLREVFPDISGHCKTDIGVDVDLADGQFSCVTKLALRDADCVGHVASVGIDHLDELLRDGRGAVQDDRETGQSLGDFLENVEAERRGNKDAVSIACALLGFELVSAVRSTDRDREGIAACSGYKFLDFFRTGIACLACLDNNFILNTFKCSELCLYDNTVIVCVFDNLSGQRNVVLERFGRSVDHNRSKSAVDAALAEFKRITVIEMECDRDLRILDHCCLNQLYQIGVVRICARTLGDLKDHRAVQFASCFCDTLNDFHIVHVECADGISAVISLLEHFSSCN